MTRERKRRRRWFVPLFVAVVVAGGVALNLWLALRQETVQLYVKEALHEWIRSPFEIGRVEFSLRRGAEISNLQVRSRSGSDAVLDVERILVVPRFGSLLGGESVVERVVLENVVIRIARRGDGRFNIQDILRPRPPRDASESADLPEIVIRGCRIRYVDESRSFEEQIDNLEFSLTRKAERVFSFHGSLEQSFAESLQLSGQLLLNGAYPVVDLRVRAFKIDVTAPLTRLLPEDVAETLSELQVRGHLDLEGDFSLGTPDGVVFKRLGGRLVRCRLVPPGSPDPIEEISGKLFVGEHTVDLQDLTGAFGGGSLDGHCSLELDDDFAIAGWGGKLSISDVPLDSRWARLFSGEARKQIEAFEINGTANGAIEVSAARAFPPRLEDVTARLEFGGVHLRHRDFPLPITDIRGLVKLEVGELRVDSPLEARLQGGLLSMTEARIDLAGSGALDVKLRVGGGGASGGGAGESFVLDERCREALPEDLVELWDSLELRGRIDARVDLHRESSRDSLSKPESASLRTIVHAFPRDVRLAYRGFPYEVRGITGEIVYDSRDRIVRLKNFAGHHAEEKVTIEGAVHLRPDAFFNIRVQCEDLTCSPDLLAALGKESRAVVEDFRFDATMNTEVEIYTVPDGGVDFKATLEILQGSVRPKEFDYRLDLVAGKIVVHGNRAVELLGVRTAEDARPSVRIDGSLSLRDVERRLLYELELQRLAISPKMKAALPGKLREFVDNFGLEGEFSGKLEGWYVMNTDDPSKNKVYYKGSNVRSSDAAVDFGPKVKDIQAVGSFVGGDEPDWPSHFWGNVFVESAQFNRLHLGGSDISFRFGDPHPHVLADREGRSIEGRTYRLPDSFLERLGAATVRDTFQMSVHSESLYGGTIDGFLFVDTGSGGDLGGHFEAHGLEMARAAKDVFRVEGRDVAGKADGHVRFVGKTGDIASIQGEGLGVIRDAKLAELPLFLELLRIFKLDLSSAQKRDFFNEIRLPYRIESEAFRVEGMSIRSKALTLSGSGTLDYQGKLNLVLRPRVIDITVPIWDQLFNLVKDALVRVKIGGDLAKPEVKLAAALGLIDIPVGASDKKSSLRRFLPGFND